MWSSIRCAFALRILRPWSSSPRPLSLFPTCGGPLVFRPVRLLPNPLPPPPSSLLPPPSSLLPPLSSLCVSRPAPLLPSLSLSFPLPLNFSFSLAPHVHTHVRTPKLYAHRKRDLQKRPTIWQKRPTIWQKRPTTHTKARPSPPPPGNGATRGARDEGGGSDGAGVHVLSRQQGHLRGLYLAYAAGLFCHIVGLFCHIVGLFCSKGYIWLTPQV